VKVHCGEGVASRTAPELCAASREGDAKPHVVVDPAGNGISLGRPCGFLQGPRPEGRRPKSTKNGQRSRTRPEGACERGGACRRGVIREPRSSSTTLPVSNWRESVALRVRT
jgi:hypothetical protein